MKKFTKDITDIVITKANILNENIKGLNFLELLKNNLIADLFILFNAQKFPFDQIIDYNKEIKENSRNIKVSINYFINPLSVTKKKIDQDSLFMVFNESSNFDIYEDEKKFTSIILYKNTGLTLPKDTIINTKYNKNVLLLKITNKDTQ
jgi:hypothetical protein